MAKKLSELTAEEILRILPSDCVDRLVGSLYLPFLDDIEEIFEELKCYDGRIDETILKEFCDKFPQFVGQSKYKDAIPGINRDKHVFYFRNNGFLKPEYGHGMYFIRTYRRRRSIVENNTLIEFFLSKNIDISIGLVIRKLKDL
jgi:hypothetical protein